MNANTRNPFYALLLVISSAFAVTAFAYAGVPWDKQPGWLQAHGWQLLLVQLAGIIACGLASIELDRRKTKT